MIYFPRTLALVVGLTGPAAGFGTMGITKIELSTETAGPNFKRPNLLCCPGSDGELPEGCLLSEGGYDCLPDDMCARIGVDTTSPGDPAGTIQEGPDWCNAAVSKLATNEEKKEACSGGKILRKQANVMTTNGDGVEFLVCSWDDTEEGRCVLAGWSLYCAVSPDYGVPDGCPGVTPVGDGRTGSDIIVASKCSNKMETSSLSFNANGSPRYTMAWSCQQKLLDCGGYGGVVDNGGDVDAECNTQSGVTWTDCCQEPTRRFRELKEEDQKQTAPADEKRKSRKLAATPEEACEEAGGTLYEMANNNKCCDNSAAPPGATTSMQVLGSQDTYKETAHSGATDTLETCTYTPPSSETGEACTCTSTSGIANTPQNCQTGGNLFSWS